MHKRRRRAEMAASTRAMLVSPNATTKGGGPHVLLFLNLCLPLQEEVQNVKATQQSLSHAI